MSQPREDLQRLASYVVAARIEAGFATRKDFADAAGVTARTLGKLETAAECVSDATLARVAAALRWTPDSPSLVMAGREPITSGDAPAPPVLAAVPPPPPPAEPDDEAMRRYPSDRTKRALWRAADPKDREALMEWLDERRGAYTRSRRASSA